MLAINLYLTFRLTADSSNSSIGAHGGNWAVGAHREGILSSIAPKISAKNGSSAFSKQVSGSRYCYPTWEKIVTLVSFEHLGTTLILSWGMHYGDIRTTQIMYRGKKQCTSKESCISAGYNSISIIPTHVTHCSSPTKVSAQFHYAFCSILTTDKSNWSIIALWRRKIINLYSYKYSTVHSLYTHYKW